MNLVEETYSIVFEVHWEGTGNDDPKTEVVENQWNFE